jgi:hypothetical protein
MVRINNAPSAKALMTTARSFGNYDLAAALADLVDNSIQANASEIRIDFLPEDEDVTVRIRDNGGGMSYEKLVEAMRPASRDPEEERDPSDLGRFGWGLKSASLSQARVLTVVTWQGAVINAARWNIDDLDGWGMDVFRQSEAEPFLDASPRDQSGTEIIWTHCDRLYDTGLTASLDERLNEKISQARRQLSLTFHRYLAGESGRKLSIVLQGMAIQPTDPFLISHPATQSLDEECVPVKSGESITVKPYVIPHFSKLTLDERQTLGGEEGMVRNQGFYVYRNKRLIIYGTWFRLVPHGELSQLTRVRVDLPNTLDAEWKITVDKSDAQLPVNLRRRLREVVQRFSKRSIKVHRRKGVDLSAPSTSPVWKRNVHDGRICYLINREHPIIEALLAQNDGDQAFIAREALRLLESSAPVDGIAEDGKSSFEKLVQGITDPAEFDSLILACWLSYLATSDGKPSGKEFLAFAKRVEPFAGQWKYAESYIKEKMENEWRLKNE